jgi:hypothetical protein
VKTGFTHPIQLDDYVALHLRANPDVERAELVQQLQSATGGDILNGGGLGCCRRSFRQIRRPANVDTWPRM